MIRYIASIFLFGVAWYVWNYNETHHGTSYMLLPLLDTFPQLDGDIPAQASWSWRIIAAIGAILLLVSIGTDINRRLGKGKKDGSEDDESD